MSDQPLYQCYLYVTPEGIIKSDGQKPVRSPDIETWRCEYFERFFRVAMVHPNATEPQILKIEDNTYRGLRDRREKHLRRKRENARHEAGHAILFYALKLTGVEIIDIRPKASLRDNLRGQLKKGRSIVNSFYRRYYDTCYLGP